MQYITIYDYVLLPIYLFIFYIIIKRKSLKLADAELGKIFMTAFLLRMLGSVAYSMLVQYYYGYGDSFTYYGGSKFITDQIHANLNNISYFFTDTKDIERFYLDEGNTDLKGYIAANSSVAVMKLAAVVSFFSFHKFLIISIFFGLFSFAGQWKLFTVFNDITGHKKQKLLAAVVLYSPSIWFWGSGLMKESICMGALGFIVSIIYKSFVKKNIQLADWIVLLPLLYIVYVIKSYIIIILLAAIILTVIFAYFQQVKSLLIRIALSIVVGIIIIVSLNFLNFSDQINDLVEESYSQLESFQQSYKQNQDLDETSKAGFEIGNFNASLSSLLAKSPIVIFSCIYRPFLWESRKIIIFLSSLETTLLLLATLYLLVKTKVLKFFLAIFSNRYTFFCLIISLLFALIIGFTTFNFGTMVRYKIALLPFFYFMLFYIYIKLEEPKKENAVISTT